MKKFLTILMVLAMVFAMGTTAFAAEKTTVTIDGENGRTYAGYQILTLTTSLKTGDHPASCTGDHDDNCYNYAYTVNAKYRSILQAEVFAKGDNNFWQPDGKPSDASKVTDEQILKYFNDQTSDDNGTFGTLRQVADRIYREILKADPKLDPDLDNLDGKADEIDQGFWFFADTTDLDEETNVSNSLIMVDTAGKKAVTIRPKTALPTVEKKVKDTNDAEDNDITDNEWSDTADHDFDDVVPFKLTATLPSNVQGYETYKIIFHDSMSSGLTLNKDSVKVLLYPSVQGANSDFDLSEGQDVTDKFVVKTENLEDEACTFEVSCDNLFAIDGVTKDTAVVVYYEATLNTNAKIGAEGNPNEVYLEYSNDAYSDSTGKTEKDKVTVFTYQLKINKIDGEGDALKGAEFKLYKKVLGKEDVLVAGSVIDENTTTFTWSGLDDGEYVLKETKVPAGYNGMADVSFTIVADHSQDAEGNLKLISLDGGKMGLGDVATGVIDEDVVNNTGSVLPETGAQGTFWLICGGSLIAILAAIFMIARKKMSVYAD